MTQNNNLPSLNLMTHEVELEDGRKYLVTAENASEIWDSVQDKSPFQIKGVGGFHHFKFSEINPLTDERRKQLVSPRWIYKGSGDAYFLEDDLTEVRDEYYEHFDPMTKTVIEKKTKNIVIKKHTPEERERAKKFSAAVRDRVKSGKSMAQILEEFRNGTL